MLNNFIKSKKIYLIVGVFGLTLTTAVSADQFPPMNPFVAPQQNPVYYYPVTNIYRPVSVPRTNAYPNYNNPYAGAPYRSAQPMNFGTPNNMQFSRMNPFGNSFSPTDMFSNNNFSNPFKSNSNFYPWNSSAMPFFPQQQNSGGKNAWGDERHIWPDFYTGMTSDMWDGMINGPFDIGRMPGGWRAPSLSTPDPVTVGDAVTNQFPPIFEEMGNMMHLDN
ncbi:MAG: Unknown protein [uncultured Thiotrichaceae bacterium]|uniref:Uncharacterized protein n=1 Tax=uncultured Thiotrichaceae bacterium TaxID=298394 RepID=A0A6S6RZ34_9GAMM|nr:MAG: Unknown protein [uncultured Thiotrichaceae bacterium]